MLLLVLLLLVLLTLPLAWGPGSHLEFATRTLRARRKLEATTARLLRDEPSAFLYGNVAADIINFKAFGGHYNHCHRWTIVGEMRSRATSSAEHAFALGYLAHLAADTIAHNHYVPYHLARYARSKGLGHLYWEMRADGLLSDSIWAVIARLKADRTLDALDELVNQSVPKKALPMSTNKLLFNRVLLSDQRDRWRRGIARLQGLSSAPLDPEFLEHFRRAAVGRIRLALEPGGLAQLAHLDTNGKTAQHEAWSGRKRALTRISGARRAEESFQHAQRYLVGMESPPPSAGEPHWS